MGIDNFKMYWIDDFCISLTLILYFNKFSNDLNNLYETFKKLGQQDLAIIRKIH